MTTAATDAMSHRPIRALLQTNWRSYRVPVIALVLIGLTVYALGFTVYLKNDESRRRYDNLLYSVADTSMVAIAVSTLIAAALGGVSIAGERADRTALFVAMLPVKRIQISLAKLGLSALIMISSVVIHLLVAGSALLLQWRNLQAASVPWQKQVRLLDLIDNYYERILLFGSLGFCMYCLAWLLGSFSRSATISACTAIATTIGGFILVATYMDEHRESMTRYFVSREPLAIALLALSIGLPSLIAGTIIYLKRTEP